MIMIILILNKIFVTFFPSLTSPFGELSLVGLALDVVD